MGHRIRRIVSAATFFRLLISVAFALVIWGFIVWETNPEQTREFQGIAVTAVDEPPNMLIVGGLPSVSVTIKGPQDEVRGMVPSDITASIDLSSVEGPGINQYDVNIETSADVRRIIVEPSSIEVELDLIVTRAIPISLLEEDTRPASVTSIETSTEIVSVQGPQALVDQVSAVELPVDLQARRESFTENVPLQAVASDGTVVEGLELSPANVELSVTFELTDRDVPIIVVCGCIVDESLQQVVLSTAAAIPSTVRVSGPSSSLGSIIDIRTIPIDVSQLEQSGWILDVELDTAALPPDVSLSNDTVDVWVPVTPDRIEIEDIQISVLGLGTGLEPSLSADSLTIVVSGPAGELEQIDSLNLVAIVDLTDLQAGTYVVDVEVAVPPGLTVEEIQPDSIRVVLQAITTTFNRISEVDEPAIRGIR